MSNSLYKKNKTLVFNKNCQKNMTRLIYKIFQKIIFKNLRNKIHFQKIFIKYQTNKWKLVIRN